MNCLVKNSQYFWESCVLWEFCFRSELSFLNCDDICMCVVKKQFELLEYVLIPFMWTCRIIRFHNFYCCVYVIMWCVSCGCPWSLLEVVVAPCVVGAVIVMGVLLIVWDVSAQVQVSVYSAWRIPAHLRCTQCSIMLHLIDICFLPCIFMWQISQI